MEFNDKFVESPAKGFQTRKDLGELRPRSASVSSVQIYQERRLRLNSFGGSQLSISSKLTLTLDEPTFESRPSVKPITYCQTLLLGLYKAYKERDLIFLACIRLSEIVEKYGLDWTIACEDESQSLPHFLIQLATEERRQADFIFEWLYSHGGLLSLNYSGLIDDETLDLNEEEPNSIPPTPENEKIEGLKGREISEILFALQTILQRRAAHIAGLLELRCYAENLVHGKTSNIDKPVFGNTCDALGFLKCNVEKIFREQEGTNKRARSIMMCLESHLKELNGF